MISDQFYTSRKTEVYSRRYWNPMDSNLHVIAAVHIQFLAGDVIPIRGKKCRCFGDLFGSRKPREGDLGLDQSGNLFRNRLDHFSSSEAGRNRVGGDVELRHFERE